MRNQSSDNGKDRNRKGCDIGYALAANSREEVSSVDTCTIAAPDVTTAFAVPDPNSPSQGGRFFQVRWSSRSPCQTDHPAYFGLAKVYFGQPFQPSTFRTLRGALNIVNARFWCSCGSLDLPLHAFQFAPLYFHVLAVDARL